MLLLGSKAFKRSPNDVERAGGSGTVVLLSSPNVLRVFQKPNRIASCVCDKVTVAVVSRSKVLNSNGSALVETCPLGAGCEFVNPSGWLGAGVRGLDTFDGVESFGLATELVTRKLLTSPLEAAVSAVFSSFISSFCTCPAKF